MAISDRAGCACAEWAQPASFPSLTTLRLASNQLSGNLSALGPGMPELSAPLCPGIDSQLHAWQCKLSAALLMTSCHAAPLGVADTLAAAHDAGPNIRTVLRPGMLCRQHLAAQQYLLVIAACSLGQPASAVCQASRQFADRHGHLSRVLCW